MPAKRSLTKDAMHMTDTAIDERTSRIGCPTGFIRFSMCRMWTPAIVGNLHPQHRPISVACPIRTLSPTHLRAGSAHHRLHRHQPVHGRSCKIAAHKSTPPLWAIESGAVSARDALDRITRCHQSVCSIELYMGMVYLGLCKKGRKNGCECQ